MMLMRLALFAAFLALTTSPQAHAGETNENFIVRKTSKNS